MKKNYLIFGLMLLVAFIAIYSINGTNSNEKITEKLKEDGPKFPLKKVEKLKKEERIDKAIEQEFNKTRDPRTGKVHSERLIEARKIRDRLLSKRAAIAGINWSERGPDNVGGRTRGLMYDPNDSANGYRKVWAGGVGGGLWYTNDITAGTTNWTQVDDFWDNIAISALAHDPSNTQIFYVGTGEGYFNADAIQGNGIWKTTNGGSTWTQLASIGESGVFDYVQDIVVTSSGTVLAAVREAGFGSTSTFSGGIYRSTNGGGTWTKITNTDMQTRGADLEIAANGDIYACMGIGGTVTGKIMKSTNDGVSWTNVTPTGSTTQRRIELATAPSNSQVLYAVAANGGTVAWFKKSTNGGTSWSDITIPPYLEQNCTNSGTNDFARGQAWYDLILTVNPSNENTVYVGGIDVSRSTNGGTSWSTISYWTGACRDYVHADQHGMMFKPGSSTEAILGNDGGVYRSANLTAGTPTFDFKSDNYNVTQFYACAMHPAAGQDYYLAGAQDNGSHQFNVGGMNSTTEVTGGDGAFCHIDQDNPNVQITSYVYNNYFVSTNGGSSFTSRSFNNDGGFINPTDYDNDANTLYGGDVANTYRRWVLGATGTGTSNTSVTIPGADGEVSAVTADPNTNNRVWFGIAQYWNGSAYTGTAQLMRVDNANGTPSATNLLPTGMPTSATISSIDVQDGDPDHLLVTVSNYGATSVYESNNGGSSWSAVEGNIPDMPVRWGIFAPEQPTKALVATELGVWTTDNLNGGSTVWGPSNSGLANVRVDMLQYRNSDNQVAAATHGRGLFTTNYFDVTSLAFGTSSSTSTEGYDVNGCSYRVINVPVSLNKALEIGQTATATITIDGATTATQTSGSILNDFDLNNTTINFTSASALTQNVEVRVYDDATQEGTETIILNIAVTGDALPSTTTQHILTLNDDDPDPTSGGLSTVTIGAGGSNFEFAPFRGNYEDSRTQIYYLASDLTAAGLVAGNINSIAFNITTKGSTIPYKGFTIKMKNTSTPSASGTIIPFETGVTTVYSSDFSTAVGWNTFNLSTPFPWDGTSNLLVEICFDNGTGEWTNNDFVETTVASYSTMHYNRLDGGTGCSIADVAYNSTELPRARFTQDSSTDVESIVNKTKSGYIGGNETANFYDDRGQVLATIKNNLATPIGCVTVTVDRAADVEDTSSTHTTPSWAATYDVSQKTFLVTAPAGTYNYDITLYYDVAEIDEDAGFDQSAATPRRNGLNIIKSDVAIATTTVATNPTVHNATRNEYKVGSKIAYTATGLTTFSGFALVDAPEGLLPVELLSFTGSLQDNRYVQLDWSTASELNNKGFEVERSIDGETFRQIGFVKGTGTTTQVQTYDFQDNDITSRVIYYRLKQVDFDEQFNYSNTITVEIDRRSNNFLTLFPNPVQNEITLNFVEEVNSKMTIELLDISGRILSVLYQGRPNGKALEFDISNIKLANGTYYIKSTIPDENRQQVLKFTKL